MPRRDDLARLRGLAGEKGFRVEKAPSRDCWFLIDEKSNELAVSDRGTTAFSAEKAIRFQSRQKAKPRGM